MQHAILFRKGVTCDARNHNHLLFHLLRSLRNDQTLSNGLSVISELNLIFQFQTHTSSYRKERFA